MLTKNIPFLITNQEGQEIFRIDDLGKVFWRENEEMKESRNEVDLSSAFVFAAQFILENYQQQNKKENKEKA